MSGRASALLCCPFRSLLPRASSLALAALVALPLGLVLFSAPASAATTIQWTNRGAGDGFDTVFLGNADRARAVVDAALKDWARAVPALNRKSTPGNDTIAITVNANPGTPGSCGGSASGVFDTDGWPVGGAINVNGMAAQWFVDPTPHEHSEFLGTIQNAFAADVHSGSPAAGLCDLYTLVALEATHILGITSNTSARWLNSGHNTQVTATGTTCSGPGDFWEFSGPKIRHLMTSHDSGGGDTKVPVHTAEPCGQFTAADGLALAGADDVGNAWFELNRRYLPSNALAMILSDVYGYSLVEPETFGTFYATLNGSELLIRGGVENSNTGTAANSDDVITVSRSGGNITVSVDVGNDVRGTGPTDEFVSAFAPGQVTSIRVLADDGSDRVSLGAGLGVPVNVDAGTGNDTVSVSADVGGPVAVEGGDGNDTISGAATANGGNGEDAITGTDTADQLDGGSGSDVLHGLGGNDTLTGGSGDDQLYGGGGANTLSDGSGNDTVDFTGNAVPVSYTTGGGNDTVIGTAFDDTLVGSAGHDRLEGGAGADGLRGGGGDDRLIGGTGNDDLVGGTGNDVVYGEDGSDLLTWDNGDGSDVLEGGAGESDRVVVTGADAGDAFVLDSVSVSRIGLRRDNLTPFNLDIASLEDLRVNAAGDADTVTVGDLSNTEVRKLVVDVGSGATDQVTVAGRDGADTLEVTATAPGQAHVLGQPYTPQIVNLDAGDLIVVDGRAGADTVVVNADLPTGAYQVSPTGPNSADVDALSVAAVRAAGAELLLVKGGSSGEHVTVQSPAGANSVLVAAGSAPDAGQVTVQGHLPIGFANLGAGSLTLQDAAREDALTYSATASNDAFSVVAAGGPVQLNDRIPLHALGASTLTMQGHGGDDAFTLPADLSFTETTADGGGSSGDTLALSGAAGAVIVDLADASIAGYGGRVRMLGLEQVGTRQEGGDGATLDVLGTSGADDIAYRPTGAQAGTVMAAGLRLDFAGVGGAFSVDPREDADKLTVQGTAADDVFKASAGPTTTVQVNTTKTLAAPQASTELVFMGGADGSDTFDVTTFDTVSSTLAAYGDWPSAKRFSDTLVLRDGSGKAQFRDVKGHIFETGSAFATYRSTGQTTRVDYVEMETVQFVRK